MITAFSLRLRYNIKRSNGKNVEKMVLHDGQNVYFEL